MSDQALAVQGAIYAALSEPGSPVAPFVEGRIYDRVPPDPPGSGRARFPYITIGEAVTADAGADCVDGEDVTVTLHVWSRAVGSVEAKRIGGAVKQALDRAELSIGTGFALVEIQWLGAQYLTDPDGLTTHGTITVLALVEG